MVIVPIQADLRRLQPVLVLLLPIVIRSVVHDRREGVLSHISLGVLLQLAAFAQTRSKPFAKLGLAF